MESQPLRLRVLDSEVHSQPSPRTQWGWGDGCLSAVWLSLPSCFLAALLSWLPRLSNNIFHSQEQAGGDLARLPRPGPTCPEGMKKASDILHSWQVWVQVSLMESLLLADPCVRHKLAMSLPRDLTQPTFFCPFSSPHPNQRTCVPVLVKWQKTKSTQIEWYLWNYLTRKF